MYNEESEIQTGGEGRRAREDQLPPGGEGRRAGEDQLPPFFSIWKLEIVRKVDNLRRKENFKMTTDNHQKSWQYLVADNL